MTFLIWNDREDVFCDVCHNPIKQWKQIYYFFEHSLCVPCFEAFDQSSYGEELKKLVKIWLLEFRELRQINAG